MQQALDIITDTGQKERKWIKDKSRMALAQGRPTMFDKELNNQITVHEQWLKAIHQIFAWCNEEALCHHQADPSALKHIGTVTGKSVNHCVKLVMILEKRAILNNPNPPYSYWQAKLHHLWRAAAVSCPSTTCMHCKDQLMGGGSACRCP